MKTKKIRRSDIVIALAFEPLMPGAWARTDGTPISECSVCAVGAVVRSVLHEYPSAMSCRALMKDIHDPCTNDVAKLLENKDYFAALSNYFEQKYGRACYDQDDSERFIGQVTVEDRKDLIRFVMKNFPANLTVTY